MASMFYSIARTTIDVDIVVELSRDKVPQFCESFPFPDFYVSEEAAYDAIRHGGMFNILENAHGIKADIMTVRRSGFNESRLSRARRVRLHDGALAMFASPEDVVLKKLEYFREGGSDKHLTDVAKLLQIGGETIDRAYIESWLEKLGVAAQWQLVLTRLQQ